MHTYHRELLDALKEVENKEDCDRERCVKSMMAIAQRELHIDDAGIERCSRLVLAALKGEKKLQGIEREQDASSMMSLAGQEWHLDDHDTEWCAREMIPTINTFALPGQSTTNYVRQTSCRKKSPARKPTERSPLDPAANRILLGRQYFLGSIFHADEASALHKIADLRHCSRSNFSTGLYRHGTTRSSTVLLPAKLFRLSRQVSNAQGCPA